MFEPDEEPEEFEIYDEEYYDTEEYYYYNDYGDCTLSSGDYHDTYRDFGEPDDIYDYSYQGNGDD